MVVGFWVGGGVVFCFFFFSLGKGRIQKLKKNNSSAQAGRMQFKVTSANTLCKTTFVEVCELCIRQQSLVNHFLKTNT